MCCYHGHHQGTSLCCYYGYRKKALTVCAGTSATGRERYRCVLSPWLQEESGNYVCRYHGYRKRAVTIHVVTMVT